MDATFAGFSRALYSNWFWHRPLQLLIDAGEGLPLALGTHVFSPSIVAITHGHSDHVLGLPGFAGARRFGKGAPDKPWTVIYPAGSMSVEAVRALIGDLWHGVTFPISWKPVRSGEQHRISPTRVLDAFAVTHVSTEPTLGYRVLEMRRRLKATYSCLAPAEVETLARQAGRKHMTEEFQHVLFAHSGDAMPIDPAIVHKADLLVHDATFLGTAERKYPIHATSEEALQVARAANVRTLVLNHLSIRYDRTTAVQTLREHVAASGFGGDCWLLDEGEFVNLQRRSTGAAGL